MVVACCTAGQGSCAHRLLQRIRNIYERHEKSLIHGKGAVYLSVPCLTWLIQRLARCWLEQDERRIDDEAKAKHGDDGAEGPPERLLNNYVRLQAYLLTAVTGLGYLALTWATVVLLGGFVTSLGKKDFWCLTLISSIQAAKIFDTLQDDLVVYFLKSLLWMLQRFNLLSASRQAPMSNVRIFYSILMSPITMATQIVVMLYVTAPYFGIIISQWRLRQRDYGSNSEDNSKANLTPALDIYYALVLLQGAFYLLWQFNSLVAGEIVRSVCRRCKFCAKWGNVLVYEYLYDTRRTCAKEPASLGDRDLITYAIGLLESESLKEYKSGARLLTTFIEQRKDVRSHLLLSRPKIQKLIDTLGWTCIPGDDSCKLIRLLASKVVANVAGNILLAQYPGAAHCIASLFEEDELPPPRENLPVVVTKNERTAEGTNRNRSQEEGDQEDENEMRSIINGGGTYMENELILQGLTILERLASNQHNCRDICNTPSLLSVIAAPIYSNTLIKDVEVSACAEVAYRSFKVLHQLIRTPGCTGRRLRREISSNEQAVSNLKKILDEGTGANQEMQMGAMEILTEMALDLSIKENLIRRLVQILIDSEGEGNLRTAAGRTLALLSSKSERNSLYIIRGRDGSADHLTKIIIDANTNMVYKITAAEILVNLCTHCYSMLPEEYVKRTLLPKVLTGILPSIVEPQQPEPSERIICSCFTGICGSCSQGEDVESQHRNRHNNIPNQLPELELLESLLSLTLLIYDKMIHVDAFDTVLQEKATTTDQFVARLKTIVEENWKPKAISVVSVRIVKLCGQIAISMMQRQRNQYIEPFRRQEFVESLSKALKIMSNLESCMLVTGTNGPMKKNARPLLFHIEKKVRELVC